MKKKSIQTSVQRINKLIFEIFLFSISSIGLMNDALAQSCTNGSATLYGSISSQVTISLSNTCYSLAGSASISAYDGIYNYGSNTGINNAGVITAVAAGVYSNGGSLSQLTNSGTITATRSNGLGFYNYDNVTLLNNSGIISGGGSNGLGIYNFGTIVSLNNMGSIFGGSTGINNGGTITTLNNGQGVGNINGALGYTSNLPTSYNIIVNSTSNYGQLSVSNVSGNMVFNIYGNTGTSLITGTSASVITANRYLNVLQGFSSLSGITGTAGTYSGYNYSLVADATTANNWDLLVTLAGPASADTQSSINYLTSQLQSTFALQSALLNNGLTYDCNVFDKNNICISTGAGYTAVNSGTPNVASGILIGAYKLNEQTRLGIWVNQKAYNTGTVGLDTTNKNPMYGIYAVWNQDKLGNGLELRASAGYESNKATTTRQVFGTSEAGVGSTSLTTQGASLTMSYNIPVATNLVASPYVGIRYSLIGLDGYTETSGATTPLTYSDMNQANTTLLAGVKLFGKVMPQVGLFGSIGLEQDLQNSAASVQASGSSQTLSSVSLSTNYQATRPIASLGAYYELDKAQRVGLNVYYASSAYQPVATTSAFITYTAGF